MSGVDGYHAKTQKIISRVNGYFMEHGHGDRLDDNILVLIDALNRIPGINTNWSCGGHSQKGRFPYVVFTFDEKTLGIDNLAKIASVATDKDWIVSVAGHFHWNTDGGAYIFEFELYPKKVIVLGGSVRGGIEKSLQSEIEFEQAKIDAIAKGITELISDGKKSFLAPPNEIP